MPTTCLWLGKISDSGSLSIWMKCSSTTYPPKIWKKNLKLNTKKKQKTNNYIYKVYIYLQGNHSCYCRQQTVNKPSEFTYRLRILDRYKNKKTKFTVYYNPLLIPKFCWPKLLNIYIFFLNVYIHYSIF